MNNNLFCIVLLFVVYNMNAVCVSVCACMTMLLKKGQKHVSTPKH